MHGLLNHITQHLYITEKQNNKVHIDYNFKMAKETTSLLRFSKIPT